jgi:hypothetical protein
MLYDIFNNITVISLGQGFGLVNQTFLLNCSVLHVIEARLTQCVGERSFLGRDNMVVCFSSNCLASIFWYLSPFDILVKMFRSLVQNPDPMI